MGGQRSTACYSVTGWKDCNELQECWSSWCGVLLGTRNPCSYDARSSLRHVFLLLSAGSLISDCHDCWDALWLQLVFGDVVALHGRWEQQSLCWINTPIAANTTQLYCSWSCIWTCRLHVSVVCRPSSGMSIQKSHKGRHNKINWSLRVPCAQSLFSCDVKMYLLTYPMEQSFLIS